MSFSVLAPIGDPISLSVVNFGTLREVLEH
jgi:hypothetical protein